MSVSLLILKRRPCGAQDPRAGTRPRAPAAYSLNCTCRCEIGFHVNQVQSHKLWFKIMFQLCISLPWCHSPICCNHAINVLTFSLPKVTASSRSPREKLRCTQRATPSTKARNLV